MALAQGSRHVDTPMADAHASARVTEGAAVPASVPNQSYLSAGRPPTIPSANGAGAGSAPKSRRMSSSTSQARGKQGAIGTWEA
jgi:hypothetical protein